MAPVSWRRPHAVAGRTVAGAAASHCVGPRPTAPSVSSQNRTPPSSAGELGASSNEALKSPCHTTRLRPVRRATMLTDASLPWEITACAPATSVSVDAA